MRRRKPLQARWTTLSSSTFMCTLASHGVHVLLAVWRVQVGTPSCKEDVLHDGGPWNGRAEGGPTMTLDRLDHPMGERQELLRKW